MSDTAGKPRIRLARIASAMAITGLLVLALVVVVLPIAMKDIQTGQVMISGLVVLACALTSLIPARLVAGMDVMVVVQAFMLGMGLRLALTLTGAFLLIKFAGMDVYPVTITIGAVYLPVMAVEAAVAAGEFRRCFCPAIAGPVSTEAVS
jgi:hypothetical protein